MATFFFTTTTTTTTTTTSVVSARTALPFTQLVRLISRSPRAPVGRCGVVYQQVPRCQRRAFHQAEPCQAGRHSEVPRRRRPTNSGESSRSQQRRGASAKSGRFTIVAAGSSILSLLFFTTASSGQHADENSQPEIQQQSKDDRDAELPRYRMSDIRQHGATHKNPWVTSGDKVYDITDWVGAHPGGDVILQAAGGSIDPYWDIFTIHKAPHVREILNQYLIGLIDYADLVDGKPPADSIVDPFRDDPERDGRFITHTARPRNAEPPGLELSEEFLTPNELFYVRNHMWVPVIEAEKADEYKLTIELPDGEEKSYTLSDLRTKFKTHKVTAVLQCSGNRRSDMSRATTKTSGLPWGVGAISNAEWEGVRLSDVLADAGLPTDAKNTAGMHAQFTALEAYGASIPLATALDPRGDVLLAFGMNGKPLPRDHGYPLRTIVPGHVAARSVKWLSKIAIADEESTTQWQRRDYKCFGPNEGAKPDWDKYPSIQEMPITSAITGVWLGESVARSGKEWMQTQNGVLRAPCATKEPRAWQAEHMPRQGAPVAVAGYAYSGGGREIVRVDVSVDGGKTWDQAELVRDVAEEERRSKGSKTWSWKRFRYTGNMPELGADYRSPSSSSSPGEDATPENNTKCTEILVKATDEGYNTQPEHHSDIFNMRGNLATAWHRVKVCPSCRRDESGKVIWSTGTVDGCGFEPRKQEEEEEAKPKPEKKS